MTKGIIRETNSRSTIALFNKSSIGKVADKLKRLKMINRIVS